MKLKQFSIFLFSLLGITLVINLYALQRTEAQNQHIEQTLLRQQQALALIHHIENDAHQLAQFVRLYISTNNSIYLRYYLDLTAIRKGTVPTPENYTMHYWYEVMNGTRTHVFERAIAQNNSIIQRLSALQLSLEEAQHLEQILEVSDAMSKTEQMAFSATQTSNTSATNPHNAHQDIALSIINNAEYLQLNNSLLFHIASLKHLITQRTQTEVTQAQAQLQVAITYAKLTIFIVCLLFISIGYIIITRVIKPLNIILNASHQLQDNQYNTRITIEKSVDELAQLAKNINELAANIETDVIHRSIIEDRMTQDRVETKKAYQKMQESIYAIARIQSSFTPKHELMEDFFTEQMYIWLPKEVVSGDIYLFTTLRRPDESLLLIIDCIDHGIFGAFLTMSIKTVYQQIIQDLAHKQGEISPAQLLSKFNTSLKILLKQNDEHQTYDIGCDGAIVYCDKQRNLVRFAGANTNLFYVNGTDLNIVNGDDHPIGYRDGNINFNFIDHDVIATPYTTFYLSTNGFFSQSSSKTALPLGKEKFQQIIVDEWNNPLAKQKERLLTELKHHQQDAQQTDDITLIAFKL